jgi:DNA-binding transcriptional LysR family regulator
VRLLDRDTRGTRLTAAGQVFLPEARAVLARLDTAVVVVQRAGCGELGRLNLAFLTSTANYMLPPVVRAMRERFPGLELTTYDVPIDELVGETVIAWMPTHEGPVLRNLLDVTAALTGTADLTSEG